MSNKTEISRYKYIGMAKKTPAHDTPIYSLVNERIYPSLTDAIADYKSDFDEKISEKDKIINMQLVIAIPVKLRLMADTDFNNLVSEGDAPDELLIEACRVFNQVIVDSGLELYEVTTRRVDTESDYV